LGEKIATTEWQVANPAASTPSHHPWDSAHEYASQPATRQTPPVEYVEPDMLQSFVVAPDAMLRFADEPPTCRRTELDPNWPPTADSFSFAWHLGDEQCQLGLLAD